MGKKGTYGHMSKGLIWGEGKAMDKEELSKKKNEWRKQGAKGGQGMKRED